MTLVASLTSREAAGVLASLGLGVDEEVLVVEPREGVAVARLPAGRIAYFATSAAGLARTRRERRVLRAIESRCTFRVPRVLLESDDGTVDVREMVPGAAEPWALYATLQRDRSIATPIGHAIGAILAEQHMRVAADDVRGFLPARPGWPEPTSWILERLPRVVDDAALIADAAELLARYEADLAGADPVLVHADLGLHNLAVDADSLQVRGVYDYGSAAFADRHHDFRYLVFDFEGSELLDAARAVYEPLTGHAISADRVHLCNAACALSFLAFRDGVPPAERSCGRTLAEDLRWSRLALQRSR